MVVLGPAEADLPGALGDDDGGGDTGVVAQRQVPPGDAETARGRRHRAVDQQRRSSPVVRDHLGIGPEEAARCAKRLREGFLGGETRGQRVRRQGTFPVGEQPAGEACGPAQRLLEAGYLDDVDADADDHDIARRTASASCPAISSASSVYRASTITRMTGSVPLGRSSTRPASPSLAWAAAAASATAGSAIARSLSPRTFSSTWGYLVISLAAAETGMPALLTAASRCRPVSTPSPVVA